MTALRMAVGPLMQQVAGDTAFDAAVLALSPWAYWKRTESSGTTFADSSGNGRDATKQSGTLQATTGADGRKYASGQMRFATTALRLSTTANITIVSPIMSTTAEWRCTSQDTTATPGTTLTDWWCSTGSDYRVDTTDTSSTTNRGIWNFGANEVSAGDVVAFVIRSGDFPIRYLNGENIGGNNIDSPGTQRNLSQYLYSVDVQGPVAVFDKLLTPSEIATLSGAAASDGWSGSTVYTGTPSAAAFTDDFNRSNEAIETSANWSITGGDGDVVSNELVMYGTTPFPFVIFDDPSNLVSNTDHYAEVTVKTGASSTDPLGVGSVHQQIGLVARWSDSNNYYWARYVGAGVVGINEWRISKVVGGVETTLAVVEEAAPSFPFGMRLLVNGSWVGLYVDTGSGFSQKIGVFDSSLTTGTVGLFSYGGASEKTYYEDFKAGDS